MKHRTILIWLVALLASFGQLGMALTADVNVLIIGSTKDSGERFSGSGYWTSQKPYKAPNSKAFSQTKIATELKNILNGAGMGTVNVTSEERYKADSIPGWSVYSYNLASWFHYPYPAGIEASTRWPNLRGENGTQWDYVILIGDPYTMEYTPGMYAHGVAQVAKEVSKGSAETMLLMPWPGSGSSSSITHYKEVVYRAGRSGGIKVVPAGLAWEASNQNLGSAHPTNNGAYLAAASIFSKMTGQNAATASTYNYNDSLASTAYSTVNSNAGKSQYTGDIKFQSPYRMLEDKRRDIHFSSRGTSTEWGFRTKLYPNFQNMNMTYNEGSYNNKYSSKTPADDGMGWPSNSEMPIAFNLGRDGFYSEPHKSYVVNPSYWQLAYGFYYQISTSGMSEEEKIDAYVSLMQTHDHDLANRMLHEQSSARNLPLRTLWARLHKEVTDSRPMRDSAHLSYEIDEAAAAFMFTMYSGRCSLDPEPASYDKAWHSRKVGYETAWMMGKCQTRAPGFKVRPQTNSSVISPDSPQKMTVQFILKPESNVTVTISTDNSTAGSVFPSTLTFTPNNHDLAQTITVYGETGTAGSFPFNVNFSSSSNDEVYDNLNDSWSFKNQRSAGPTPSDIRLLGNGEVIMSGDSIPNQNDNTDFGIVTGSEQKTFTIRNRSTTKNLSLTSSPRVSLNNTSGYFSLLQDASKSTLAPGDETTFTIKYQPLTGGTHTETVTINSNDSVTPSYTFDLLGKKASLPTVVLNGTTEVSSTSAVIKGKLTDGGYGNATICWGTFDGGVSQTSDWQNVTSVGGVLDDQSFSLTVNNLDVNATYWYRCHVSNESGSDWSDTSGTFNAQPISGGGSSSSQVILSSDFSGRTISGSTAQSITWNVSGVANPGDITAQRETPESQSTYGGLFDTADTAGLIAADRNIGTEGPWSINIPLVPSVPGQLSVESVTISWKDFNNSGASQTGTKPKKFTASILNSSQSTLATSYVTTTSIQSSSSFTFNSPPVLLQGGSYTLNIRFENNSDTTGNNTGLGSVSVMGTPISTSPIWATAPTSVSSTSAQLNGAFDSSSILNLQVYWGSSDAGNLSSAWANSSSIGSGQGEQNISKTIGGLTAGQTYYYTFKATEGSDSHWAPQSWRFTVASAGAGTPVSYDILATSGTGGSLSPAGTTAVEEGKNQSYLINPDSGYQILNVTVNGSSLGAVTSYIFDNVSADQTIHATFGVIPPESHNITASSGAGGSISPNGTTSIEEGNSQTYTVSPDSGYRVQTVTVDGSTIGAVSSYTFSSVSVDHIIQATFELIPAVTHNIIATMGAGGSISPSGTISVVEGDDQAFTMIPDQGYEVADVRIDGVSIGVVSSYTFSHVTSDHTLGVIFSEQSSTEPWTPAEITTELWLDASASDSLFEESHDQVEHEDGIYQWKDQSGKNRDLSQNNSIVRPVYNATGWGDGLAQIEFDTYNGKTKAHSLGRDISADGFPSTGYTIFAAINPRSIDKESWLTTLNTTEGVEHRFQINNTGLKVRSDGANGGSATAGFTTGEQILQFTLNADNSELRRNGEIVATDSGSFTNKTLTGRLSLSGRNSIDGHAGMDADLAEYILISGVPSQDIRLKVEGYLAHKWSLEGSLPSDHPYKDSAPGGSSAIVYQIKSTAHVGGSITPEGSIEAEEGESLSFVVTPNAGFVISDVVFEGVSVGALDNLVVSSVYAAHTIEAFFTPTSTPWTPSEISTELWLDATESATLLEDTGDSAEDDDLIYAWQDRSGKERDLSQGALAVRPRYNAAGWSNGLGQIEFNTYNGTTRAHSLGRDITADGLPSTGYTVFAAINPRSIDKESWLTTMKTTDGKEHRFQINSTGVKVRSDGGNGGSATATYTTGEQILQLTLNADASEIRRNGVQIAANSGSFTNKTLIGDFALSGRNSNDGHAGMDADLAEYILISGVPSEDIRQKIEGYLAHKWGLETGLPVDHPYKSVAPGGSEMPIHQITSSSGDGGKVTPAGIVYVQEGSDQTVSIMPDPGYLISDVTVDGISVGPVSSYQFSAVTSSHTLNASFKLAPVIQHEIYANVYPGGSMSPSGIVRIEEGSNQNFSITPDSGFVISEVLVDGVSVGSVSQYVFFNVQTAHSIDAFFDVAPVTWTPELLNAELWLDASASSSLYENEEDTIEDTDVVYQWQDLSGNERNLSQSAVGVRPKYNATGWSNGKAQIEFDTYNGKTRAHSLGRDITADGFPSTGYTIFVAINPRSIDKESWLTTMRSTEGKEYRFQINNTGVKVRSDSANGGSDTASYETGEQILQLSLDADFSEIRRNGVLVAGNSGSFTSKVLSGDFALSGRSSSNGHGGMDADLAEYILVSGVPSEEDRHKIEGYLAHKWDLKSDLSSDHPYKHVAP